ncbi:hypothetical protein BUQ74_17105 [Leptospira weilii serovar Heyan]|nr:hypothetical protein BUQ74_17105 [Leptospira weilii serovar Heyan]
MTLGHCRPGLGLWVGVTPWNFLLFFAFRFLGRGFFKFYSFETDGRTLSGSSWGKISIGFGFLAEWRVGLKSQ